MECIMVICAYDPPPTPSGLSSVATERSGLTVPQNLKPAGSSMHDGRFLKLLS